MQQTSADSMACRRVGMGQNSKIVLIYDMLGVGYKRAKEFLEERYGDSSEVDNAHIRK